MSRPTLLLLALAAIAAASALVSFGAWVLLSRGPRSERRLPPEPEAGRDAEQIDSTTAR